MKYKYNGQWNELNIKALDSLEIGTIVAFGGTTIPYGWLECDGASITQSAYPELYALIGGTLPNFKGRVLVGQDTNDSDFNSMFETGGSKYLQAHQHVKNTGLYKYDYNSGYDGQVYKGDGPFQYMDVYSGNVSGDTQTGNSGNLQPYSVVKWIIKALNSTPTMASVVNATNNSTEDTYSCDYINKYYGGVVLYENASGSNQTINLSDSASNYNHFVIVYKNTDWNELFTYMKYDSDSAISITGNHVSSTDRDLYTFKLTMSGTTITWGASLFSSNNGTPFAYNPFKITKVIGYK